MFKQNDPRAWGKAAVGGALPGFGATSEAIVARLAGRVVAEHSKPANIPGLRGFQKTAIRRYRATVVYRLGMLVMSRD